MSVHYTTQELNGEGGGPPFRCPRYISCLSWQQPLQPQSWSHNNYSKLPSTHSVQHTLSKRPRTLCILDKLLLGNKFLKLTPRHKMILLPIRLSRPRTPTRIYTSAPFYDVGVGYVRRKTQKYRDILQRDVLAGSIFLLPRGQR